MNIKRQLLRILPFFKSFIYINSNWAFDFKKFKMLRISPNLIVLGAQKSGTSSLVKYLDFHPEIYATKPIKESGYYFDYKFMRPYFQSKKMNIWTRTDLIKNFALKMYSGEKFICDATTFYTLNNEGAKKSAVRRMNKTEGPMYFIYIIRNPYERIISNYKHTLKFKKEALSFQTFVEEQESASVRVSLYFEQLEFYKRGLKSFNLKVLFFEDLLEKPKEVLQDVYDHIGEKAVFPVDFEQFNKSISVDSEQFELNTEIKNKVRDEVEKDKLLLLKHYCKSVPESFLAIPKVFRAS